MENTIAEPPQPEPESKVIGLTGGIGSGKSTVARMISNMGYPVYHSDERAKEIVNTSPIVKKKIIDLLGDKAYDENGEYNRPYVASLVFEDKELLQHLNEIIHPEVREDFKLWLAKQVSEFVYKETALLFELNLEQECYKSLLVSAEDNIRAKRVMDRDHKTYREVEAIMDKQMPEKDKIHRADYVIYNNSDLDHLQQEVEKALQEIQLKTAT